MRTTLAFVAQYLPIVVIVLTNLVVGRDDPLLWSQALIWHERGWWKE